MGHPDQRPAHPSAPLTIAITTSGYDRESICWEQFHYGRQFQARVLGDSSFFRWWGAAEDDPWDDEATWRKVQPNLGISVSLDFMRAEARQARQQPARENAFRRLYLNQWTSQATRWMSLAAWVPPPAWWSRPSCRVGLLWRAGPGLHPGPDRLGARLPRRRRRPSGALAVLAARGALGTWTVALPGQASVWVRQGWLMLTPRERGRPRGDPGPARPRRPRL